ETQAFLRKAIPFPFSTEAITRLEARTEGWVTGLRLLAQSPGEERLHQLIKCARMLDMRTMSTPCKHFQATLGGTFALLCVSDRNDRVGLSPDDQHRTIQPFQCVMQVDALLSIPEGRIGGQDV